MVGRLLWKEFREGWLVLLIAAIAPWAMFSVALITQDRDLQQAFEVAGGLCSPSAIMLWAASKGVRRKDEGKLPLAHLPANPIIERLISLVIPLALSALAGAWLGAVAASPSSTTAEYMRFGALYMFAAFAGCYLISAAISTWAGIAAGIVWAMVGMSWIGDVCDGGSLSQDMKSFVLRSAIGLAVCLVLFLLLAYKKRLRIAQVSSISLLIVVMLGPLVYNYFKIIPQPEAHRHSYPMLSNDRSLLMYYPARAILPDKTTIGFTNNITGLSSTEVFDRVALPIVFDNRGYGYIAQQIPKSGYVRIIAWNGKQKREVARMPAEENAMDMSRFYYEREADSARPDGRYLMVKLRSYGGRGLDIWIVNLRTGDAWIAFPNVAAVMSRRATWFGNKLALSGRDDIWTVDLLTMKTGALRPGVDGGNR